MNILDKIQATFTAFIDRTANHPVLAPAFFMDGLFSTVADRSFEPVSNPCPFDEFWLVYESNNPPFGTITNIVLCQSREARLWTIVHGVSNRLVKVVDFSLDNTSDYKLHGMANSRAVRETTPEIRLALNRISNNNREPVIHPALARLNASRVKKQMKKVAPYIVITQTRSVSTAAHEAGGSHSKMPPHDRRGHWRTYKATGKCVWVSNCTIHGGRGAPRDYRVTA